MATRVVVYTAVIAALYWTTTLLFAPISYGPVQFRVSELLKPLALFHPVFALGFGLGTFLANLSSPYGILDWGIMPFVDIIAALMCFHFRESPYEAIALQAFIISFGVAVFPLGIGGNVNLFFGFFSVLISEFVIQEIAYVVIWRKSKIWQFLP